MVAKKLRVPAVTEEFLAKLRKEVKVRQPPNRACVLLLSAAFAQAVSRT